MTHRSPARRSTSLPALLALLALAAGCSSASKQDLSLLPGNPLSSDAELERLRRMERVQVVDATTLVPADLPTFATNGADDLDGAVKDACPPQQGCSFYDVFICESNFELCQAKTFLAIVNQVGGAPPRIGKYLVPPQSPATNVALAQLARSHANSASSQAAGPINDALNDPTPPPNSPINPESNARRAVPIYAEAFQVFREASDAQYQALLAAADDQISSSSSLQVAESRTIAGEDLSRAAAAHLLVGGAAGLLGGTTTPFCTEPELSPDAQAALSLLRESALSPADLAQTVDINVLLNGDDTAVPGGSVRARLVDHYPQLGTVSDVSSFFSLSKQAFATARQYMVEEIAAFGRSQTATLPKVAAPGGALPKYSRYVATANRPAKASPAYFSALARAGDTPDEDLNGLAVPPTIAFTDSILSQAAEWLPRAESAFPDSVQAGSFAPLALMLSSKELRGRLSVFTSRFTTSVVVSGYAPSDRLLGVFGEDALHCAVDGTIEGAPCTLDDTNSILLKDAGTPDADFATAVSGHGTRLTTSRFYLVQSRNLAGALDSRFPGQYTALFGFTHDSFGRVTFPIIPSLEKQAALAIEPSREWCAVSQTSCAGVDYDARLPLEDDLTQDSTPSESSWRHYLDLAAQAATTADNLGLDYLNQGLTKSQNALSIQERQLEQESRADDEISKLEDICGTAIDPNVLLKLLSPSDPNNSSGATSKTCTVSAAGSGGGGMGGGGGTTGSSADPIQGTCDPGYDCISGECIVDIANLVSLQATSASALANVPDLQRIADCISESGLSYVSLGTNPVCFWKDKLNPNNICTVPPIPIGGGTVGNDTTIQRSCPVLGSNPNCTDAFAGQQPLFTEAAQTTPLGYISSGAGGGQNGSACTALRKLRAMQPAQAKTDAGKLLLTQMTADNTFNPTLLQAVADRIDLDTQYGGFAAITVDGAPRYTTGTADGGVSSIGWPCQDPKICGADETGMFCHFGCLSHDHPVLDPATANPDSDDARRARALWNYVMIRSILAAKLIVSDANAGDYSVNEDAQGGLSKENDEGKPKPNTTFGQALSHAKGVVLAGGFQPMSLNDSDVTGPQTLPETTLVHFASHSPILKYSSGTEFDIFQTDHLPGDDAATLKWLDPTGAPFGYSYGPIKRWHTLPYYQETFQHGSDTIRTASSYGKDYFLAGLSSYSAAYIPDLPYKFGFFQKILSGDGLSGSGKPGILSDIKYMLLDPSKHASLLPYIAAVGLPRQNPNTRGSVDDIYNSHGTLSQEDMLNGLELLCEVSHSDDDISLASPPVVRSVDDLARAAKYVTLVSEEIAHRASLTAFANVPETGINALKHGSVSGAYPRYSGQMGTALSNLRGGLEQVQETIPVLANEVRQFGDQLQSLHDTLQTQKIQGDISGLQLASTISSQLASCASSVGGILSSPGAALGSVASCANSIAQISIATSIHGLEAKITDNNVDSALASFDSDFSTHITNLQTAALNFSKASEAVEASLSTIEGLRDSARISISRAVYLLSSQAAGQAEVTNVIGNLYNGKQLRYQAALKNARVLSFIAKRAIEQHIGVKLSTLTDDLPLVDAPSKWEASVCSLSGFPGLSYAALTQGGSSAGGGGGAASGVSSGAQSYAGGFIGDYVTKLQNVVESYPLVHNFQEGTDTAVVSLRDDVMNVRAKCEAPSGNLLYQTVNLQPGNSPGWSQENCDTKTVSIPAATDPAANPSDTDAGAPATPPSTTVVDADDCISVFDAGVPPLADFAYSEGRAFTVKSRAGSKANTRLDQTLDLRAGDYRLSYYTTDGSDVDPGFMETAPSTRQPAPAAVTRSSGGMDPNSSSAGWTRRFVLFNVPVDETVKVGFKTPKNTALSIAAPMLESLPPDTTSEAHGFAMTPFVGTAATLSRPLPVCEDTNGAIFRATEWRHDCLMLCADGYADTCGSNAVETCFREAQFGFNQRDIQQGKVFNYTGFARGNFNYRIDSMALNFVGTGIRDCSHAALPATCNSAGFVPYTLLHNGPFYTRNFTGNDTQAFLFDGTIEHARGLATERYLTNPLSDADKSLVTPYTRFEFQGRPLDGNFIVRVWDDPSVNFEAIQDIQVVLAYRYWTAFK